MIESVRGGEATLGWVRLAEVADLVPAVAALSVPFLFRDPQKALAILDAAALGPLLNDQLRKQGLEPLAYLNVGALRLAGDAPVALGSLAGQRITARPGALREVAFRALGLELVPGVPVGGEAGATPLVELRTDDLAATGDAPGSRAVAEAPHAYDLVLFCANRERFEKLLLAPDILEMLRTHAQEMGVWQRGGTAQVDAAALAALRQRGAQLVGLPEEELRQAHERVKAAVAAGAERGRPVDRTDRARLCGLTSPRPAAERQAFAAVLRTVARGPSLSRPLRMDEAEAAMGMILADEVDPLQLGAFLLLLRFRGETAEELAGFVRAARTHLVNDRAVELDLDWPSYADSHRQLPYFLLAALLLARNGYRILLHGVAGEGPAATRHGLAALGLSPARSTTEAAAQVDATNLAYLPVEVVLPGLARLLMLKPVLGLRTFANSMARELNPFRAPCQIQGVFHPPTWSCTGRPSACSDSRPRRCSRAAAARGSATRRSPAGCSSPAAGRRCGRR